MLPIWVDEIIRKYTDKYTSWCNWGLLLVFSFTAHVRCTNNLILFHLVFYSVYFSTEISSRRSGPLVHHFQRTCGNCWCKFFYRSDALPVPVIQITVSKQWCTNNRYNEVTSVYIFKQNKSMQFQNHCNQDELDAKFSYANDLKVIHKTPCICLLWK